MSTTKSREIASMYAYGKVSSAVQTFCDGLLKECTHCLRLALPQKEVVFVSLLDSLLHNEHLEVTTKECVMIVPVNPTT